MSYLGFAAQHHICTWWNLEASKLLMQLLGKCGADASELTSVLGHPCLSYHSGLICITQPVRKIHPNNTLSWETGVSGHDVIHKGVVTVCIRYRRCLAPWKGIKTWVSLPFLSLGNDSWNQWNRLSWFAALSLAIWTVQGVWGHSRQSNRNLRPRISSGELTQALLMACHNRGFPCPSPKLKRSPSCLLWWRKPTHTPHT